MIVIVQLEILFFLLFLAAQSGVVWCLVLFREEFCDRLGLSI
jgi:hypothetical protein